MKSYHKILSKDSFWVLWGCVAVVYACIFITIEFIDNPAGSFVGFVTLALQWLAIAICSSGLMGLLMLNKYVMAVSFTPLLLVSTVLSYYRITTGITLTPAIIELTLQNDVQTAMTVISWQLVVLMAVAVAVGVALTVFRFKYVRAKRPAVCAVIAVVLMLLQFVPQLRSAIVARLPYSLYYCTADYLDMRKEVLTHRDTYDNVEFNCSSDSLTVVVVIGEALRPDHLQINGYQRETTPLLMKQSNIISFPNVRSEYCHTYISLPHIMTEPVDGNPDAAYDRQSFITPLKKAGFYTAWLSNQDDLNSYSYFMHEADTLIRNEPGVNPYVFGKNLDGAMLPDFDRMLQRSADKRCILLHCAGSHWLYTSHFPDDMAVFKPNIKSRVVSANSHQSIINSYDNTVLYTDFFINGLIERLKHRKAVLIYQADHGEALGENGQYLHGFDNPGVAKAACLIWYSDLYQAENSGLIDSLRRVSARPVTTTHMFHTVLTCAGVSPVK